MFGIDIVIEKGTTNHVVIDINYFPGIELTISDFLCLKIYLFKLGNPCSL